VEFADLILLPEARRLVITEHKPSIEVERRTWSASGGGSYYASMTDGEIIEVKENGSAYAERFTVAECDATVSTFFMDLVNRRLYLHTSTGVSPSHQTGGVYDFCLLAYFLVGFADRADADGRDPAFAPEIEKLLDGGFEDWTSATALTKWTKYESGTSVIARETTEIYSGAYSLKMTVDAAGDQVLVSQTNLMFRPGCKGRVRFRVKSTVAAPGIVVSWQLQDSAGNIWLDSTTGAWGAVHTNAVNGVTSAGWTELSYDFTASPSYSNYKLLIFRGTADHGAIYSIYVDVASLVRMLEPMPYRAIIPQGGAPSVTQSVGDYYVGDVALSAGELRYGNDGWWYEALEDYIWHLKKFWLKVGAIDSTYAELGTIFWGRTTRPTVTDEAATFQITDAQSGLFGMIPTIIYDLTTYPNMNPDSIGQAIPILFGELDNITPVCIDTTTFEYLIACHPLQDISAVYKDGVALTPPGDYTATPATAIIDLTADPGDAIITCKAKGAKCKIEDGTYSALGADILFHALTVFNSPAIQKSQIDLASFLDLRAARTQALAMYLTEQTAVTDIVRDLQDSNVFHLIPLMNETFGAFRYAAGVTGLEVRIDQLDMASFTLGYDTAPVRKTVVIKYGQDPTTKNWLATSATDANIGYRYDQAEILEKETLLTSASDAAALASFYLNIIRSPEKRVSGSVPALLLGYRPAEKLVISKSIRDGEGEDQIVLAAEVYRALSLIKNAGPATVDLEAVLDLQSTGSVHNDIAHLDTHVDTHSDTPHGDAVHDDSGHSDTHGNVAHDDGHADDPHQDVAHEDVHSDAHSDHTDVHADHWDDPYHDDEGYYPPYDHSDWHFDSHVDTHTDTPYSDEHWDTHTDWHYDSNHGDAAHADAAHADVAHVDTHGDIIHGDSEY
jgi:hypothetical protein